MYFKLKRLYSYARVRDDLFTLGGRERRLGLGERLLQPFDKRIDPV